MKIYNSIILNLSHLLTWNACIRSRPKRINCFSEWWNTGDVEIFWSQESLVQNYDIVIISVKKPMLLREFYFSQWGYSILNLEWFSLLLFYTFLISIQLQTFVFTSVSVTDCRSNDLQYQFGIPRLHCRFHLVAIGPTTKCRLSWLSAPITTAILPGVTATTFTSPHPSKTHSRKSLRFNPRKCYKYLKTYVVNFRSRVHVTLLDIQITQKGTLNLLYMKK